MILLIICICICINTYGLFKKKMAPTCEKNVQIKLTPKNFLLIIFNVVYIGAVMYTTLKIIIRKFLGVSLFLLVLIISISTLLFIHLTTQKKNKFFYTKYLQIHCEKYKGKKNFFYIVREENIRPQVLRDRISPPFFQHYEKKNIISYP